MVHDIYPSDIWYHEIVNDYCPVSDGHPLMKYKSKYGFFDTVTIPSELNDRISMVERRMTLVKKDLKETYISGQYYKSCGAITQNEWFTLESQYNESLNIINDVVRKYRMFRGWKSLSIEEYMILYNDILADISLLREQIRDRYLFEREIERRIGIQPVY